VTPSALRLVGRLIASVAAACLVNHLSIVGEPNTTYREAARWFTVSASAAQAVSGAISGLVSDQSGAVLPSARITVANVNTGVTHTTTTNASGFYVVSNLIPGEYTVAIEVDGFKRFERTGIPLNVDSLVRVDATLTVGGTRETVSVTTAPAILKTDRADVGGVITGKTLNELPVIGRNVSLLVSTLPGALRGGQAFIGENPGGDSNGFVNGLGGFNNYHQYDGIDNQETIQGVAMINPNIDSLHEMTITTNTYDAEYGQVAGAVFQASTKSGTNTLHGSVFEYYQDDAFFARNPFTQSQSTVAPWQWNQFGGSAGGPLLVDKLFFFGDWQAVRSKQGSTLLLDLPTEAFKRGDFSAVASQYPIFDPLTGDANGFGRTQFPGNIIPANRLNPSTMALVQQLPNPNRSGSSPYHQNYEQSGFFISDTDGINGRVDYNASANTRLFGRYSYLRSKYDAPPVFGDMLGGVGFGPQAQTGGTRTQNLSLNFTRVFRPNLYGEFRFGFSRFRSNLAQPDVGLTTASDIGIPGINLGDELTDGLPQMAWDGPIVSTYVGNPFSNFYEVEQSLQYVTNWSAVLSSHTLKWGADLRPHVKLQRIDKSLRGAFNFNRFGTASADVAGVTGLGFASFLLGYANNFSRGAYIDLPIEFQDRYGAYVQDRWRVSSNLTLTLGVRWDYFSPTYSEGAGRETIFDLDTAEMVFANLGGINKYAGVEPVWTNFSPRLGLAYTIGDRTVLRAGYGRSYAINAFGANFGSYCCQWPIGDNQNLLASTLYGNVFPLSQGPPPTTGGLVQVPDSGRLRPPNGQFVMARPFDDPNTALDAWNVTLQRQVANDMTVELAYVGNKGRDLWRTHNANAAVPGPGPLISRQAYGVYGLTQWIDVRANEGRSTFNSLQARLDKRFSKGYQVQVAYTWQKTMMDNYANPFDINAYRGPTGPSHWATISHVVELPFGQGRRFLSDATGMVRALVEGWQFSGITQLQSGAKLTPSMNANTLNVDYAQRPDRIADGQLDNPTAERWFDASAFTVPPQYTFGDAGTGIIVGPGLWNVDLALDKNFIFGSPLNQETRLALRWHVFNAFNHVNLGNPNMTIDAPGGQAGRITSIQGTMRRMQLGLHLYF
jgi:Carboxypeptidase regulatory-like domain/TonB dependent receptor